MELTGTVLNVVDFGAFVDIGVHHSGLVHVSQLADKFVRDPHEVVAVGDIVKVWVLEVDKERRRVSLTHDPAGHPARAAAAAAGQGRGSGAACGKLARGTGRARPGRRGRVPGPKGGAGPKGSASDPAGRGLRLCGRRGRLPSRGQSGRWSRSPTRWSKGRPPCGASAT